MRRTVCILLLFIPLRIRAQSSECIPSSLKGTDFWCMFLDNLSNDFELSLIAAGDSATTLYIENPLQNWHTTVSFDANGSVEIPIPRSVAVNHSRRTYAIDSFALHITATAPCLIYASNYAPYTFDITSVLPTIALSSHYYIQHYPSSLGAVAGLLAMHDSTLISFTLPCNNSNGIAANTNHQILLHRGQTYTLHNSIGDPLGNTFLGVEITGNKPFAMFQGDICTMIPVSSMACDHVVEQSIPTRYWGRDFIVVPTAGRGYNSDRTETTTNNGDLVHVTSSADGCRLYRDGMYVTTLQKGETYTYTLSPLFPVRFNASQPIAVTLYLTGVTFAGYPGDPASVVIAPIEQGTTQSWFQAIETPITVDQYVNIVAHTNQLAGMMLDYQYIDTFFHPFDDVYSYAQMRIPAGLHRLENHSPFIAHFYGLGMAESYAYNAGMNLQPVTSVYDTTIQNHLPHTYMGYTFSAATQHYRIYFTDTNGCDSLIDYSLHVRPNHTYHTDTTLCTSQLPLQWQGISLTDSGSYIAEYSDRYGCDSNYTLTLHVVPTYDKDTTLHLCYGDTLWWDSLPLPTRDTTLTFHLATTAGCDSIIRLHIKVHQSQDLYIPIDTCTLPYTFRDTTFTTAGTCTLYRTTPYGCDSNIHVTLTLYPQPQARLTATPLYPDAEHPQVTLHDHSLHAASRLWVVDETPTATTATYTLLYPLQQDSLPISLIAISTGGCSDTAHLTLMPRNAQVWLPNTFTPDLATNSRFCLYSNQILGATLTLYNRRGYLITQYDPLETCWDGTDRHGTPLPQDTYVYLLEYTTEDSPRNPLTLTGTITLLR